MSECEPHAVTPAAVWRRRGVVLPGASGYVGTGGVVTMPNRCPVCGEEYVDVLRGQKVTIPEEYDDCHRSVSLAAGGSIGKWYLHDRVSEGRYQP